MAAVSYFLYCSLLPSVHVILVTIVLSVSLTIKKKIIITRRTQIAFEMIFIGIRELFAVVVPFAENILLFSKWHLKDSPACIAIWCQPRCYTLWRAAKAAARQSTRCTSTQSVQQFSVSFPMSWYRPWHPGAHRNCAIVADSSLTAYNSDCLIWARPI